MRGIMSLVVKGVLSVLLLAVSSFPASAGEVSGTWNVDGAVEGHPVKYACTLKQEGETLSGTARVQEKDVPVTGSIEDSSVTWKFEVEYEGAPLELIFSGTFDSERQITGTIAVSGAWGDFTATRQE